ncbi:hypothetical protein MKY98_07940 [Paenibacillus sp. FSL M8-0228]|uniref:hypothetical protein n=1 Tax=Paenibacillus sp. FSL M8-0228 TaxID=2921620 RepID=UPI0030FAA245
MKQASYFFFLLSFVLLITGFVVAYHYGDYNAEYSSLYDSSWDKMGHVVGGDAYNYIIMGMRGILYGVASLVFAIIGCFFFIMDRLGEHKKETPSMTINKEAEQIGSEV